MAAIANSFDRILQASVPRFAAPTDRAFFVSPEQAIFTVTNGIASPSSFNFTPTLLNMAGTVTYVPSAGVAISVSGNNFSLDYSNLTVPAGSVVATLVVDGVTYTRTVPVSRVVDGIAPKLLDLAASSQVFQINKAGVGSPGSIELVAKGQNLTGTPNFTILSGTAALAIGADSNRKQLTLANMSTDSVTIQVAQDGQNDTITIVKVREGADGANAVAAFMTNETQAVPANLDGSVISMAGATTTMKVFVGATDDSASWTYSGSPASSASGITYTLGSATGVLTASAVAAGVDSAYVDVTASRNGYPSVTKRFSLTKSKTGPSGQSVTGPTGARGNVNLSVVTSGSAWSDAEANAAVVNMTGTAARSRDVVNLYRADRTWAQKRVFDGFNWSILADAFDGSIMVKGSVLADAIDTRGLTVRALDGSVLLGVGVPLAQSLAPAGTLNSDIKVAGRNIIQDSAFEGRIYPWGTKSGAVQSSYIEGAVGAKNLWIDGVGDAYVNADGISVNVTAGVTYNFSCDFMTSVTGSGQTINPSFLMYFNNGGNQAFGMTPANTVATRQRFSTNWTCPAGVTSFSFRFGFFSSLYGFLRVYNFKMAVGNADNGWSAAPEDSTLGILAASNAAAAARALADGAPFVSNLNTNSLPSSLGRYSAGVSGIAAANWELMYDPNSYWCPRGKGSVYVHALGTPTPGSVIDMYDEANDNSKRIDVTPGFKYEYSVALSVHRCIGSMRAIFYKADGTYIGESANVEAEARAEGANSAATPGENFPRVTVFCVAPADAAKTMMVVRLRASGGENCYVFASEWYVGRASQTQTIPTPYTDFSASGMTASLLATKIIADAAKKFADDVSNDGILDRGEKATLKLKWAEIDAEKIKLEATAMAQGITTAKTEYLDAHFAASNYLLTIQPPYNDTSQDSPIDRALFNSKFSIYADKKMALQNALDASNAASAAAAGSLTLIARGAVVVLGNTATKVAASSLNWDSDVYSKQGYTGGAYVSAVMVTLGYVMIGLNADPTADGNYSSLDYAIETTPDGYLYLWAQGGTNIQIGTYVVGDQIALTFDGSTMRWLKNGVQLTSMASNYAGVLYFDSSFCSPGVSIKNIEFGPMSSTTWGNIGNRPADADILNSNVKAGANLLESLQSWVQPNGATGWLYQDTSGGGNSATDGWHRVFIANFAGTINSRQLNLTPNWYTLSFRATADSANMNLIWDLYPDTLPEHDFPLTPGLASYQFTFQITAGMAADADNCVSRFIRGSQAGQAVIFDVKLEVGKVKTGWSSDVITAANAPSLVGPNAITNTMIGGDLLSTNWNGNPGVGGAGWAAGRSGNFYINQLYARGAVSGGSFNSDYAWPSNGLGGYHLSASGLLLGNPSSGKYFQVSAEGNMYMPGLQHEAGQLTLTNAVLVTPRVQTTFAISIPNVNVRGQPNSNSYQSFGTMSASMVNGVGPFRYLWTFSADGGDAKMVGDPTSPTVQIQARGTNSFCNGYLNLNVTDANGAQASDGSNIQIQFGSGIPQ